MGRAFEYRKATKLKRWGHMAKTFTKIGKEITIAVKAGGPDPDGNPRLRALIQTAKSENMPKDNIERAIKRATDKDTADYKEVIYEGYGPAGIAIFVTTATDNTTRTVGNVRNYFNRNGGQLGTQGSLSFLFEHKCMFTVADKEGLDMEEFELELIDYDVEEVERDEEDKTIFISAPFESNSKIQAYLEEYGFEIKSVEFEYQPNDYKEVTAEQREAVQKILDKLEEDDDVQAVFHNMKEEEE